MKLAPYPWLPQFENALLQLSFTEPTLGGNVVRLLRPERIKREPIRTIIKHAKPVVERIGLAPSIAEINHLLYKATRKGKLDEDDYKGTKTVLKRIRGSNVDISREVLINSLLEEVRTEALLESNDIAMKFYAQGKISDAWEALELGGMVGQELLSGGRAVHLPDEYARIERMVDDVEKHARCKSPIAELDRYMRGGVGPGEIAAVLALPNYGKSTWLTDVAATALLGGGGRVAFYSLEMYEHDVVLKITSALLGLPLETMKPEQRREAYRYAEELLKDRDSRYIVRFAPQKTLTVQGIRSDLKQARREFGFVPTLVEVDYADCLLDPTGNGDFYQSQGDTFVGLKSLAQELWVALWTGVQAKRDSIEKKVLDMGDVAESFRKIHVLDYLVSICAQTEERETEEARLFLAKNRFGKAGVELGPYPHDWECGRFLRRKSRRSEVGAELGLV